MIPCHGRALYWFWDLLEYIFPPSILLEYCHLICLIGIFSTFPSFWNIFLFSIILEYFHLFHPFGMYSHLPSIWNIFIFSILLEYFSIFHLKWVFGTLFFHFMPISQGEGLCAQKKLQPLRPPNCLLEGDWSQIQWLDICTYKFSVLIISSNHICF